MENKEFKIILKFVIHTFGKMVVPSTKIGHTGGVALQENMMISAQDV